MKTLTSYDAFISYRRGPDSATARALLQALGKRGVRVFIDVEGLSEGPFDKKLLDSIAATPNFIVILSPKSLDRCHDPQDWFRQEIAQALSRGRNIIPVLMPGFEFPPEETLPEDIRALARQNGVRYSHEFFDATVNKIYDYLQLRGSWKHVGRRLRTRVKGPWTLGARVALAAACAVLALGFGFGAYKLVTGKGVIKFSGSRPLTGLDGRETAPAFSPDGEQLAYVWDPGAGKSDLYIKRLGADADDNLPLTNDHAVEHSPAWSPHNDYVAYLREPEAGGQQPWGFYKVSTTGARQIRVANAFPKRNYGGRVAGRCLSWSPDGKYLAVMDKRAEDEPFRIFLIPSDPGGEPVPLTDPKGAFPGDSNPAFSPDGRTLAFTRAASTGSSNIFLQRLDGVKPRGEPVAVTEHNKWVIDLAWTPDAGSIIYSSNYSGGHFSLWMLPAAERGGGAAPASIGGLGDNLFGPAVSSKWDLAFSNYKEWDINILEYDMRQPGPPPPTRLQPTLSWELSPHLSADGQKIAFASDRTGSREIYVYERGSPRPLQLTKFDGPDAGTPRVSPDGSRVAFDSEAAGNRDIYVVEASAGARPRDLTHGPSLDVRPSWSPDGQWVYFGSNRTGSWQVWKVRADGASEPSQVTNGGGREAFVSGDGQFVYYAKEVGTTWGVWRAPRDGGEETPVLTPVRQGYWALTTAGIYYLAPEGTVPLTINLYRFDNGATEQKIRVEKEPNTTAPGLAASPDGRWILYQQQDQLKTNIMVAKIALE